MRQIDMTEEATYQHSSAAENTRELTDASKQLLEAGQQVTENLSELSHRIEHAKNVSSEALKSPWLTAGAAIAVGALILLISRKS
jgi:ElaB/YqjD/DUF883 family membrane-anchored ribosome-binding protein